MKKKIFTVLVAVILILCIAGGSVGMWLKDKYAPGTEKADMQQYFGVEGEECAIILQDEMIEEKAIVRDGTAYLQLQLVHEYLNDAFYLDQQEALLLYTDAEDTTFVKVGENSYAKGETTATMPFVICFSEGDVYYLALEYVKLFTNFSYELFENHLQLNTLWENDQMAKIQRKTQVRLKGGIKSPILRELAEGEDVEILEQMDNWSKVKTADSIIGYVENKRLGEEYIKQASPVTDYIEPAYPDFSMDKKVCLGWHSIGGVLGNSTLDSMVSGTKGMNVIAPTWFSLNDDNGGFRSFGEASYVERAHALGLQVWGVWDNFNFQNETGTAIDDLSILSSTTIRQKLVQNIASTAVNLGLDGVNIDFEQLNSECGKHFVQFVRELSVACHKQQLVFSVDNYMPNEGNRFYRTDVQGKVADYVILMGYDEHWHGSKNPGSVASIGFVSDGIQKTIAKVPEEKVVNALPFYTIVWAVDGTEVTDEYLTMNNLATFLNGQSVAPVWDEITCQNYIEWTSGTKNFKSWLEDAESIRVKLNVMSTNNLGGVAVWRLGFGVPAVWELINMYVNS